MTHDELLARISLEDKQLVSYEEFEKRNSALRAVVELHKPYYFGPKNEYTNCNHCNAGCWGCEEWSCDSDCDCDCHQFSVYPCPTIQAIEKELS